MKILERTSLLMLGAVVLAIPLSILAAGSNVLYPDVRVSHEFQEIHFEGAAALIGLMNTLGQGPVLMAIGALVAALLLYVGRRKDAAFAILPVTLAQLANVGLKFLFSSPRPTGDYVAVTDPSTGFGFPSGHTMTTVVLIGSLAYILLRQTSCRWRRAGIVSFVVVIALAMGFSRIYVGAHWPSDVLGAYLWGTAFTSLAIIAYRSRWFARHYPDAD
jgi:membrane-associated phospholipid phosphatase